MFSFKILLIGVIMWNFNTINKNIPQRRAISQTLSYSYRHFYEENSIHYFPVCKCKSAELQPVKIWSLLLNINHGEQQIPGCHFANSDRQEMHLSGGIDNGESDSAVLITARGHIISVIFHRSFLSNIREMCMTFWPTFFMIQII